MIDLTPLDVRKKRGDFRRVLRGYDPQEVDSFIELVAERFEDLVKENLTLKERSERLEAQVNSQEGREKAVQQALVTAQELREEIQTQARREAEFLKKEAEQEIDRILEDARRMLSEHQSTLEDLRRRRIQFLRQFKGLLTKELEMVELEEERATAAAEPLEIELSGGWRAEARKKARAEEEGGRGEEEAAAGGGEPSAEAAAAEPEPEAAEPEPEPAEPEPEPARPESAAVEPEPEAAEPEPEAAEPEPEAGQGAEDARSSPDEPLWLSSLLREGEAKKADQEKKEG